MHKLYSSPWLNRIWTYLHWSKVSNQLNVTYAYKVKTTVTFRSWAHFTPPQQTTFAVAQKAVEADHTLQNATKITRQFKNPLSFLDAWSEQVLRLKRNWFPTLSFRDNAKDTLY